MRALFAREDGVTLLEMLIAGAVLAIAVIGVALLFSWGQTFVVAQGDDRIAIYLAQQKIESLRTSGFDALQVGDETLVSGCPNAEPCYTETGLQGGTGGTQTFARETRIDYVSDDLSGVPADCAPGGSPTEVKRICVTVTPSTAQALGVTLQSYCVNVAGGC